METNTENLMARALAPEDIQPGDYVTVLHHVVEHMAAFWELRPGQAPEVYRLVHLPSGCGVGAARVLEVCLPFVLVRTARGKHRMVDVRQCRLARISAQFGERLFAALEAEKAAEKTGKPAPEAEKSDSAPAEPDRPAEG